MDKEQRLAEDEDIRRAAYIGSHIDKLNRYFGRTEKIPVFKAITYLSWSDHPLLKKKIDSSDYVGMDRIREALGLKYRELVPDTDTFMSESDAFMPERHSQD